MLVRPMRPYGISNRKLISVFLGAFKMMRQVCTRMVLVAVHSRACHELVIRCLFPPLFSSKSCRNYDLNEQQLKRLNERGRGPRSPASERIESDDEPTLLHLAPTMTNTLVHNPPPRSNLTTTMRTTIQTRIVSQISFETPWTTMLPMTTSPV